MELEFKPDFEAVQERWSVFWRGQSPRPMMHAIVPRPGVTPVRMPRPYSCAYGDLDPIIEQALAWASTHDFLGDAIPGFAITLAPDHFAALLGAEIQTGHGASNWVEPCLTTLEDADIRFRKDSRWWQRTVECVERFRARCDGKLIITGTHLQGGLDCLTALYSTQNLLMDLAIAPENVHHALDQIDIAVQEVRRAMAELLDIPRWGSLNRFGMYSTGIIDVPQCDVSCMVSPAMFREFELPHLSREIDSTDASIYHLDGPGAVQHLQSIGSIDRLDMIQWMPGEGHYDDDHADLNARIDALGKGQIFQPYYNLSESDVKRLWETFRSRKLYFMLAPGSCLNLLDYYASAHHCQ